MQWLVAEFGEDPQILALFSAADGETLPMQALEKRDQSDRDWLIDSIQVKSSGLPELRLFQFTDITDIRELQRQREEMMRFISHDLRSPQISILSALEQIPLADRSEWTSAIEKQASNSLQLAESFVQWTRAESKPFDAQPLDLADIAIEAVDAAWMLGGQGKIPIRLEAPESAPASGDAQLVRRALGNLIENAIKYGGKDNAVTIQITDDSSFWMISVSDTGPGLVGVDSSTLFDPYVRGKTQTDRAGTGLGLAFVRMVARRHSGRVGARNLAGGGACFELALPKDQSPASASGTAPTKNLKIRSGNTGANQL